KAERRRAMELRKVMDRRRPGAMRRHMHDEAAAGEWRDDDSHPSPGMFNETPCSIAQDRTKCLSSAPWFTVKRDCFMRWIGITPPFGVGTNFGRSQPFSSANSPSMIWCHAHGFQRIPDPGG